MIVRSDRVVSNLSAWDGARAIKKAVAERARELGAHVHPSEVTLEIEREPVASGCRLFRGWWGAGEAMGYLSGLLRDQEPPDTYPARALEKVFQRWIETDGELPEATLVAKVIAYLYDAAGRHEVIFSEKDKHALVQRPDWLAHIRVPEGTQVGGQTRIQFWWVGPRGPSQVGVYFSKNGSIRTEELWIQDVLKGRENSS